MKIAIFHNLPPGGAKRTLYEEVRYLSKHHFLELFEFSSTDESFLDITRLVKKTHKKKFDLSRSDKSFIGRLKIDFKNFVTLRKVHKAIADQINTGKFDVVLVHPDMYTESPFILRYLKVPSIYFCHEWLRIAYEKEFKFSDNVGPLKNIYERLTRQIRKNIDRTNARSASKILTSNEFVKRNIYTAYKRKAIVDTLGVNTKSFFCSSKERKNYIFLVGGKNKYKGYDLAQKALERLPKSLRPQLKVLGFLKTDNYINNDKKVRDIYSQAICTLCLAKNEPFGLSVIESMACETPVIALDSGGYRETVIDGVGGYLVKNADDVAKKLTKLIKDKKLAHNMGRKAREYIIANFTWEKHNKILETEMEKLIHDKA